MTATQQREIQHYIGGRWVSGAGARFEDVEPAHPAHTIAAGAFATATQADRALAVADRTSALWRAAPPAQRAAVLVRAAAILEDQIADFAAEIALEQGKPVLPSSQELSRAAEMLRYFSHLAYRSLGEVLPSSRQGERILTVRKPVGPSLVITPWNVPVLIPVWKLAPALMAGNAVIWKPSEQTPLVSMRLIRVLEQAGLPDGVLQMLISGPDETRHMMIDGRVKACSFTGSTAVGKQLIESGAKHGVRVLAEMGGNNATIVMADADLAVVVPQLVNGSMLWSGQRCTATSRVLVDRRIYGSLLDALAEAVSNLRVGDPFDGATDLGPVSTLRQFDSMLEWFDLTRRSEARIVVGGSSLPSDGDGWYVQPTLVADAPTDHPLLHAEPFGPIAVVVPFDTVDEAFGLANSGPYGLSGAIYTNDLRVCLDAIDRLRVGVLHVNSETTGTEPHAPFGGLADSGTPDKEMGSGSIDFFLEESTVYVRGI